LPPWCPGQPGPGHRRPSPPLEGQGRRRRCVSGELAEQAGISTKAIRYDEQIGILTRRPAPPPATAPTTRRPFPGSGSSAQALGLTLGEIRQIIAFRARIRVLQQLHGELRQLAERATTLDPEHCPPERVCHIIG
jgi:hypothetical protein